MRFPKWRSPDPVSIPPSLLELLHGRQFLGELLMRRGIVDQESARAFLDPDSYSPSSPYDLPQMDTAVERIRQAIEVKEQICVWGDFDVDGQTSTALLVSVLERLGGEVRFHIPIRAIESHGMKIPALEKEIKRGVDLILTCDTGVSANEAVAYANAAGVDVIITDHHELPEILPPAAAILNPKLLPEIHPLYALPGVGCAYKLAQALLDAAGMGEAAADYLDLVALGIVADVAELRDDVRYLLQRGLPVLRGTKRAGLLALFHLARLAPETISETDIGFGIAPRMNALGRLDDANAAVEFLTTSDPATAFTLATKLETLNAQRRMLVEHVTAAAHARLEREPDLLEQGILVLEAPNWPGGVIGIVASRLVEEYHQPTILLSVGEDGIARGSARSLEGLDIAALIASQKDLLMEFGGHPMAGGMALRANDVPLFRRKLGGIVQELLAGRELIAELSIDAELPWKQVDIQLAEELTQLSPFGAGNPTPVFVSRGLQIIEVKTLGQEGRHLKLTIEDGSGSTHDVLRWNAAHKPLPEGTFDLAFTLQINTFQGERKLQLEWVDSRQEVIPTVASGKTPGLQFVDCRSSEAPLQDLKKYSDDEVVIWAEGMDREEGIGLGRHELHPARTLAIWTIPPGQKTLQDVLKFTSPERVIVFAQGPGWETAEAFLRRLAGASKRALVQADGRIDIHAFAAVCACTPTAIRLGLRWQEQRGFITVVEMGVDEVRIDPGGAESSGAGTTAAELQMHLREIQAYRTHFRKAALSNLMNAV